jgi:hypothetical protein
MMVFICTERDCKFDGDKPYMLRIPLEVYERNNLATLFCPYCGCMLEKTCDFNENEMA